jgi:signal recognition particle GTPase
MPDKPCKETLMRIKIALLSSTMSEEKKNEIDPTRQKRIENGISDKERIKEINQMIDEPESYSINNGV